ncbi:unnamed protein product [Sphagnum jensenii]|uniref:Tetratricopeptide repeat protein 1 n=1 Tax=Sphagnum jensenii TaxID=128206 RepID=A0ABP1B4F2_9BRYO
MVVIELAAEDEDKQEVEDEKQAAEKKGSTNGSSTEAEGEGWETASEGDESHAVNDGDSLNGKAATTTGASSEEHFEDAMTEEEQRLKALVQAGIAKTEGNKLYAAGNYEEALQSYARALESAPDHPSSSETRAQCYSNRAICQIQLSNYAEAVKESTKALELDPNYMKALMRRAQAQEKLENFQDAITDLKKVIELDPGNRQGRESIQRLEPLAAEKAEKMKAEMLGKLKEMGNSLLGRFGMSIDNFKAVQDPNTGSYSISFQK